MKCDKCSAKAVIYQKYSGMRLCPTHFGEDVHRKIRDTLRESRLFGRSAKVAVALNGDANSATLAYVLKSLFSNRRDVELCAVMIDEGIECCRPEALDRAKKLTAQLEIPFIVRSFKDAVGSAMGELANTKEPCSACETIRNELLNRAVQGLRANVLATGHSLDDEAGEIMLKYLHGDIEGLLPCAQDLVPIIRPLRRVPAKEIKLYARIHDLPFSSISCLHVRGMRYAVVKELMNFEIAHPGTNYSLLRSIERVKDLQTFARGEGAKPLSSGGK